MTKQKSIDWTKFSTNSPEFLKAEKADTLGRLMHQYFSKNAIPNVSFIDQLALSRPKFLIDSIRNNRAFLNNDHATNLNVLIDHSNSYVRNHARFFKALQKDEKCLFSQLETAAKTLHSYQALEILLVSSLWFESKRAAIYSQLAVEEIKYDLHPQIETVNFFLSYYFFGLKPDKSKLILNKDDDHKILIKFFNQIKSPHEIFQHPIWNAIEKASQYHSFSKGILEIYCFDLNYDVDADTYGAALTLKDETKLKRWFVENAKMESWLALHRNVAELSVREQVENNPYFIPDSSGYDYAMNLEGAIRKNIMHQVMHEFGLDNGKIEGVKYDALISFLNGFVSNAWGRYVYPLDQLNSLKPEMWFKNIFENAIMQGERRIAASPLRVNSQLELIALANKNVSDAHEVSKKLVELISTDVTANRQFDKFKTPINLIGQPFLKMGDHYVSLNGVVGETNSQVNLLINLLESNHLKHSRETKNESNHLELKIMELFKEADFKYVICSRTFNSGEHVGDFDILVYEKGILFMLEIKSTRVRIHLSEAHDDYQNSLIKASNQLEKGVNFIRNHYATFLEMIQDDFLITEELRDLQIYPMIISSSFENDHVLIRDRHLKISLFELSIALAAEIEMISSNRLLSLIHSINSNKQWKDLEEAVQIPEIYRRPYITPL